MCQGLAACDCRLTRHDSEYTTRISIDITAKPIRVLHVDDEESLLRITKQCLEIEGDIIVESSLSADDALQRIKKECFNAVVSDYHMPGKDGISFLKELRDHGNNIPFIIFTGKGREEVAIKALNLGADQYINKIGDSESVYCELAHSIRSSVKSRQIFEQKEEMLTMLRATLDSTNDGLLVIDNDGKILLANPRFKEMWSIPDSLKDSRNTQEALPTVLDRISDPSGFMRLVDELRVHPDKESSDTVRLKDGRTYERYSRPLKTGDFISGRVWSFHDMTEALRAEESLEANEEKFSSIFENANDAIVYGDLKGKILDMNQKAAELAGLPKEEMIGKSFREMGLLSLRDVPKLMARLASFSIGRRVGGFHVELKRKDGEKKLLEVNTTIMRTGKTPAGFLAIIRDVTERKRAERAIRESQQKFEGLFEHSPEAAVYLDVEFKILDVNPLFCQLFGYSEEEVSGRNLNDVVVPEGMIEEAVGLDKAAKDGYVSHETVRKRKTGSLVAVSISAAPVRSEDKLLGYVGLYKDISDRKKLEEKLRVVGSLTRHDVANKLCAVTANVYLLNRRLTEDPEVLEKLKDIGTAVRQVERIFDFAKTYEKLGVEKLVSLDVGKAFDEATSLFSDLKSVKILNECNGLEVTADSLLRQVFYNFIDNSLKYGDTIQTIRLHHRRIDADRLELIYEDDGVGISSDMRSSLFKEGAGKGTGYGLFLLKRICEVYGWVIREEGQPGKGARFIIDIPTTNKLIDTHHSDKSRTEASQQEIAVKA